MRLFTLMGICLLLVLAAGLAQATLLDDSLAALRARPDPGCHFSFAVIADTHTGLDPKDSEVLRANLAELALLRPELVLIAGDLIKGSGMDTLEQEWAQAHRDLATCGAPLFPSIGNHDVAGPEMAQVWQRLNSPLRYSFDWGGCHFISLNSMEKGGLDNPESLGWLRADLAAAKGARHIFVFFHSPDFAAEPERWQAVHDTLRQYPVRMVFAGHWHNYLKFEPRDGIQYVVAPAMNGTGALQSPEALGEGRFGGYLLVHVRGDQVSFAVVRPGSVHPPEIRTEGALLERRRILQEAVQLPVIGYGYGQAIDRMVKVTVTNPSPVALVSTLTWEAPGKWQVMPGSRKYEVPAGGQVQLEFRVKAPAVGVMYPTPTCRTDYRYGPKLENALPIRRSLVLKPTFAVPHTQGAISVDGRLAEWKGVPAVPLAYAQRISIKDVANLSAQVQMLWDESRFYLAVTVRDNVFYQPYTEGGVWQADALEMTFDPRCDGNEVGHRGDDYDFSMALTASGVQPWVARCPEGFEGKAEDIALAVQRQGDHTIYEIAFPAARLGAERFAAGRHMGFSLAVQDLDGQDPSKRHWWVEMLPGVGGGFPCPLFDLVLR